MMATMPQFSSPAADYIENRISLDMELIKRPSSTYFIRYTNMSWREGIKQNALLVVDTSVTPVDGSLVMCHLDEKIMVRRLRLRPCAHLEELDHPERKTRIADDDCEARLTVKGVVTYIINDARSGEFDDCPVM